MQCSDVFAAEVAGQQKVISDIEGIAEAESWADPAERLGYAYSMLRIFKHSLRGAAPPRLSIRSRPFWQRRPV